MIKGVMMDLLCEIDVILDKMKSLPKGTSVFEEIKEISERVKDSFFLDEYKSDDNWSHMIEALRYFAKIDPKAVREGLKFKFSDISVSLDDYRVVLEDKIGNKGTDIITGFCEYAQRLKDKGKNKIAIINATFAGGGVAEMLLTAGPILAEIGIELEWHIIYPHTFEFYHVTKTIHNTIQGKDTVLSDEQISLWNRVNEINFELLQDLFNDDSVARFFVEDPQVAPLVGLIKDNYPDFPLSWRKHIDIRGIRKENPGASKIWNAMKKSLSKMNSSDVLLFQPGHIPSSLPEGVPFFSQYPGIDPLKNKNFLLNNEQMQESIQKINDFCSTSIDVEKKYIVVGARFDYWKGIASVLRSFEAVADKFQDINLVVFGGYANDDPEGVEYFELLKFIIDNSDFKDRIELVYNQTGQEIGALYRLAGLHCLPYCAVSIAEGYCLMTDEASVQGAVPFTSEVGGLSRYPDGKWKVDILSIAEHIDDAASLYKIEEGKLVVDTLAQKIEDAVTEKFNNFLKYRSSDIESYNEIYIPHRKLTFEMTYKYSLISMLYNYMVLADADADKLSVYKQKTNSSVDILR